MDKSTTPEFNSVAKVSPDMLEFDFQNPRLVAYFSGKTTPSEQEVIQQLNKEADIKELMESISANGYLDIEPLIVMPSTNKGKWKVLEGNRRLAAIKLFHNPDLAKKIRIADIPPLPANKASLDSIAVYGVNSEEAARAYIGFKHVNGPHKWDAYAKAIYASKWYKAQKDLGLTIEQLSQKMGDGHDTIRKMLWGIFVLEQADEEGIFSPDECHPSKRFAFSHLYTALSRSEFRKFLEIDPRQVDPEPNPIPKRNLSKLGDVMGWLYGNKDANIPPVLRTQNPDLKYLGAVINNGAALAVLRETLDLDKAWEQTKPSSTVFSDNLAKAKTAAEIAASKAKPEYGEDDSVVLLAEDLKDAAINIVETLKRNQKNSQDDSIEQLLGNIDANALKQFIIQATSASKK